MSKYGRLWEDASNLRHELRKMFPNLPDNFTPDDVRKAVKDFERTAEVLISRWESFERTMKQTED